ncbi:MAG: extracellular solute-binding protein [Chloroflexi bacterium]|nr:extracellular solute-binding protein [Chloroflexota bacterium]
MSSKPQIKNLTRRDFLKASGAVVGAAALAACAQPTPTPVPPTKAPAAAAPTAAPAAAAATGPVFAAPAILKGATINYMSGPWYVGAIDDAFRIFVLDWATQNKVKFNWDLTADANDAKINTYIEAKSGPNLILSATAPATYGAGTVDVTDVADALQADIGAYYPIAQYFVKMGGKWRGIPWGSHPHVMVYRTDWFKEAGYDTFPKTWDGPGSLYEAGVKLKAAGHPFGFNFGVGSPADGPSHIWSILWSFGAKEWNKDGSLAIDSPEMLAGLEFINRLYKDCLDPASTSYDESANNQNMMGEKISLTINVNSIYLPTRANNPTLAAKMNHAPHPAGPKGQIAYTKVPYAFVTPWTKGNDLAALKQFLYDAFCLAGYSKFIKAGEGYLVPVAPGFDDLPIWPSDPKLAYAKPQAKLGRIIGYDLPEPNALSGQCFAQVVWNKMVLKSIETGDPKQAIAYTTGMVNDIKKQLGL